MLGELNKQQIEDVLHQGMIGRIGCYANNKMYVVPVTYAYDGLHIYAHSKEGKKIEIMRKNPNICFEVEAIENMTNWRSVIVWGKYQELKDSKSQERGLKILRDRFAPMTTSETAHRPQEMRAPHIVFKEKKAIAYRIVIKEQSGRFEKSNL
jgi:nitroimidazol reductase NimA-like FMN-containing flavoprotein (pyridoxamine 5'-phosphate oxidase superfamily)